METIKIQKNLRKFFESSESFLVEKKYEISSFISSSKLLSKCMASIDLDNVQISKDSSNLIERIQIDSLHKGLENIMSQEDYFLSLSLKKC